MKLSSFAMQSPGREPSMEDILASIKKVIAEEKELRTTARPLDVVEDEPLPEEVAAEDDVLELNEPLAPPVDLGPPLVDEGVAGQSRQALEQLQTVAATHSCCTAGQSARRDGARDASADAEAVARRKSAADGRRACEARDLADHRAAALDPSRAGRSFATPAS